MRSLIAMLCVALAWPAGAALYRQVDDNGEVTYTDVAPSQDARPVELPPVNTMPAPAAPARTATPSDTSSRQAPSGYEELAVTQPQDEQAVRANNGQVSVSLRLAPALRAGDRVRLLMDGSEVALGRSTQYTLENVDRGTHTVAAEVVGVDGEVRARSGAITFHVLRHSILQ